MRARKKAAKQIRGGEAEELSSKPGTVRKRLRERGM